MLSVPSQVGSFPMLCIWGERKKLRPPRESGAMGEKGDAFCSIPQRTPLLHDVLGDSPKF